MKQIILFAYLIFSSLSTFCQYYPSHNTWEEKEPSAVNVDAAKIQEALDFAMANEYSGEKDLRVAILKGFSREPFHDIKGPVKPRGGPAGLIIKDGYIIAKWGDVDRVDMTFSVTKSYLSTIAGLALDHELIDDVDNKVANYVWDGSFNGEHNQKISWHHLLNQSSDWSGSLFGLQDWADRPPRDGGLDDWKLRKLYEPGTNFEYNDVRVNLLAYSLLQVWREPLPKVLKKHIMDPIGASTTWRWYGYDDAWVPVDGLKVKSVTGGGHSGGGMFVNTIDQAKFGYLFLRNGKWNNEQLISQQWINMLKEPSEANESYGYMWWLNRGSRTMEGVNSNIFYAAGFGGNYIVVDQNNDLLVVTRWLEPSQLGEFLKIVNSAMK